MWGFNVETNLADRVEAAKWLLRASSCDQLSDLTPSEHRNALRNYCFVASPPGNGLDTHRTWEAMYLRCVPIILRSHMSERYEGLGLPLWIVDSYGELLDTTEEELRDIYENVIRKSQSEALWSEYWFSKIKSRLANK